MGLRQGFLKRWVFLKLLSSSVPFVAIISSLRRRSRRNAVVNAIERYVMHLIELKGYERKKLKDQEEADELYFWEEKTIEPMGHIYSFPSMHKILCNDFMSTS